MWGAGEERGCVGGAESPAQSPQHRAVKGGAPQKSRAAHGMPEASKGFYSPLREISCSQIPPALNMFCPPLPWQGHPAQVPQLLWSGITCAPSFSQREETGRRAPALQQQHHRQHPTASAPALIVLRTGREPRLCCRRDWHLAHPNKLHHSIKTQPWAPGEERLMSPAMQPGNNTHRDPTAGDGRAEGAQVALPAPVWAQPPAPAAQ